MVLVEQCDDKQVLDEAGPIDDKPRAMGDHIDEFRKTVILVLVGICMGFVLCLFLNPKIIKYIQSYYVDVMESEGLVPRLQTLSPSEGFISYVRIAAICGVALAAPWTFYQFWRYASVGLYDWEKRLAGFAALFSAALFILGAAFFLCFVAPFTLRFFIGFNKKMLSVESEFTFQKYMSFITSMVLIFGLAFQTPTVMVFLHYIGAVTLDYLQKVRKYVLLAVFIIAMLVTPPDFVSQVTLAIPLYGLFEVGILLIRLLTRFSIPGMAVRRTSRSDEARRARDRHGD